MSDGWKEDAETAQRGSDFYREIVQSIGALFADCYISDDGSVQDEPLALKVRERVVRELESDKAAIVQRDERIAKLEHAVASYQNECHEVEQILGKALGYPWFKDDAKNFPGSTEADGVCVGDHVPSSIALEAVRILAERDARIAELEDAMRTARESLESGFSVGCKPAWDAALATLRSALRAEREGK